MLSVLAALTVLVTCPRDIAIADSDALWHVVHDQCVANELQHHDPAPCSRLDMQSGVDRGYAVLKDLVGDRQYLLIPTAPITGIESPELLDPGATNYFAAAWLARSFTEQRAGGTIPRSWMSLAVNSPLSRSQNQLHIHIDCLRADVHESLSAHMSEVGFTWTQFPEPLAGQTYRAMAISGDDLDDANPFALLASDPGDTEGSTVNMSVHNLVVVGADDIEGQPGFIVLASHADTDAAQQPPAGEQLQDHDSCPAPLPPSPSTSK